MGLGDKHASNCPLVLDIEIIYYCTASGKNKPDNNPGNVLFGTKKMLNNLVVFQFSIYDLNNI